MCANARWHVILTSIYYAITVHSNQLAFICLIINNCQNVILSLGGKTLISEDLVNPGPGEILPVSLDYFGVEFSAFSIH